MLSENYLAEPRTIQWILYNNNKWWINNKYHRKNLTDCQDFEIRSKNYSQVGVGNMNKALSVDYFFLFCSTYYSSCIYSSVYFISSFLSFFCYCNIHSSFAAAIYYVFKLSLFGFSNFISQWIYITLICSTHSKRFFFSDYSLHYFLIVSFIPRK